MKSRDYEKPTMQVIELQHMTMLMTSAKRQGYGKAIEQEWG